MILISTELFNEGPNKDFFNDYTKHLANDLMKAIRKSTLNNCQEDVKVTIKADEHYPLIDIKGATEETEETLKKLFEDLKPNQ